MTFPRPTCEARLAVIRATAASRQIDALIVTFRPTLQHLAGLAVSVGAVLVTPCGPLLDDGLSIRCRG